MRTGLIIWALLLSIGFLCAQENKKAAVRIKKIEKIDGVEKVTDTTYTINSDESEVINIGTDVREFTAKDGTKKRVIIMNEDLKNGRRVYPSDSTGKKTIIEGTDTDKQGNVFYKKYIIEDSSNGAERVIYFNGEKELTKEEEKTFLEKAEALRELNMSLRIEEAEMRKKTDELRKTMENNREHLIILDEKRIQDDQSSGRREMRFITIRPVNMRDLSSENEKVIAKTTGIPDGKLSIGEIKFYPNPNDGKFTLSFTLLNKGATGITIFNEEGKKIYEENLNEFSGKYEKEIDISSHPKGAYFLSIKQGEHAQLKKIVLD